MMIIVPMLIEKVNARTNGRAQTFHIPPYHHDPPFTNVDGTMMKGKWKAHPKVLDNGHRIEWVTVGSGIFGGNEFGKIDADFGPGRHVTFTWSNPDDHEKNGCSIKWTGIIHATVQYSHLQG